MMRGPAATRQHSKLITPHTAASMARKISARHWFYILFPLGCFFVFAYPVGRLANWYAPGAVTFGETLLLWIAATVALWYSFTRPKMVIRYVMAHWLGVGFVLFSLTAVYEVVRLAVPLRDAVAVAWILGGAAVLVVLAVAASHYLTVKHLAFDSAKLTRPHRIVQISDVHIGSRRGGYLQRIVTRINRLQPDTVVITGDLIDSSSVGHDDIKHLRNLRARTLFTIGNHERYADLDKALDMLERLGVEALRQRRVMVGDGEIQVIGIDDADAPHQVAEHLPGIERHHGRYTVLLYHRPQGWEAAIEHGVDLMLCGHTHNGQIFPFNWFVKHQFRRIRGLYRAGDAHLYVSPGTGTWGPLMRLGSLNEITCIDLRPG
ncbi:MAG: metallophosphoesterase [Gammaproteobacteria bacterium]|nr:metallophosphoesterase [Gammaproteobacteria bacterium]